MVYGSAATLFYWTKWLGKLVSNANRPGLNKHTFHVDEEIPILVQSILTVAACFCFPFVSKYALIPYLSQLFGTQTKMPISSGDEALMLVMLTMLIILPISFLSFVKKDSRRKMPVYMGGRNTGKNDSFYGFRGEETKMQLRNWYLEKMFGSKHVVLWSNVVSIITLCAGGILLIGGFVK